MKRFMPTLALVVAVSGCATSSDSENDVQNENQDPNTSSVPSANSGAFTFGEPTWVNNGIFVCDEFGCEDINFNVSSQIHGSRSGHPASLPAYVQTENLDTIGDVGNVWAVSGTGSTHNPKSMSGWFEFVDAHSRTLNTWPNPSHYSAGTNDQECFYANQWGNFPYECFDHQNVRQWWPSPVYPVTIIHHTEVDYEDANGEQSIFRECSYEMQVSGAISGPNCNTCGSETCPIH